MLNILDSPIISTSFSLYPLILIYELPIMVYAQRNELIHQAVYMTAFYA